MSKTYLLAKEFVKKYPMTIAWRVKSHCKVIDKHLNPGEEVLYVFFGQKNKSSFEIFNTNIVVLTNKRLLFATKRVVFGYYYTAVTPDMFNDISIRANMIWGSILIDTVKEVISLSNIDKAALDEIETKISEYMMIEKKKYKEADSSKEEKKKL